MDLVDCVPQGVQRTANTANPGTILQGLRIENSPYNFTMKARAVVTKQHACKCNTETCLGCHAIRALHVGLTCLHAAHPKQAMGCGFQLLPFRR